MQKENSIVLFNQKQVRRHWDEDRGYWYFSVIDVVSVLTNSSNPRRYWSDLKSRLKQEGSEVYDKIVPLKMTAPDGKQRQTVLSAR
jgi:DNA-damage-inducible protein D